MTGSTSATFAFTDSEQDATFECSLNGAAFASCSSPKTYAGLTSGTQSFAVRAADPAGNRSAATTHTWTVDATPPTVSLLLPAAGSATGDATTTFSGTAGTAPGDSATVTVNVYSGSTTAGTLIQTLTATRGPGGAYSVEASSPLADGTYTGQAHQADDAGNTGQSSAVTFSIDTVAPETTIFTAPTDPSSSGSASFTFDASETGSSFACQLDGGGYSACTSPKSYTGLADGSHTFEVRATDTAGNTDPTSELWTWTVDSTSPDTSITSAPTDPTNTANASFSFSASEAGSSFACQLDGGGYSACTSPKSYTGLADGSHTFQVRATDAAGNTDPTPASRPGRSIRKPRRSRSARPPTAPPRATPLPPSPVTPAPTQATHSTITITIYAGNDTTRRCRPNPDHDPRRQRLLLRQRAHATRSRHLHSPRRAKRRRRQHRTEQRQHVHGRSRCPGHRATECLARASGGWFGDRRCDADVFGNGGDGSGRFGDGHRQGVQRLDDGRHADPDAHGDARDRVGPTRSRPPHPWPTARTPDRQQQADDAGNTGHSSANSFSIDTTAPETTILTAPARPEQHG